ncbi:MAG: CRISPR-associated endonuclease Cas2 [Clostridiaceae bacterium]|nr:CRISPR-associated endonuclease Cas2 [Clostridiaceae bacterium]
MRVLLFFDLPTITNKDMKEYRRFRKHLIRTGFIMLQESVYCKLVLNATAANAMISNIKKYRPEKGLVQLLTVTEKQFSKMEFVTGEYISNTLDSDERLVVL